MPPRKTPERTLPTIDSRFEPRYSSVTLFFWMRSSRPMQGKNLRTLIKDDSEEEHVGGTVIVR